MSKPIYKILFFSMTMVSLHACDQIASYKTKKYSVTVTDTVHEMMVEEDPGIEPAPGDSVDQKYMPFEVNSKFGLREKNGKIFIPAIYDRPFLFSEGVATVSVGNKFGLINEEGKFVLPLTEMTFMGRKRNGLIPIIKNDLFGFIDERGIEKIKPSFRFADEFSEGLCVVMNDQGKYGYIDNKGNMVIKTDFEYGYRFFRGTARVKKNGLWGSINKKGEFVEKPTHKDLNWH